MSVSAIVVAAGRGARLRPFTDNSPKCLLPFAGRRLIDWQLAALHENNISSVGLVRGYRKEMLGDLGLITWDNDEWESTNMVYSLLRARDFLTSGDDIVVVYGDIVFEPRLLKKLLTCTDPIAITVDRNWRALWELRFANPFDDAESLRLSSDEHVIDIGRKVANFEEIEAQYMGLLKFSSAGVRDFIASSESIFASGDTLRKVAMTDVLRAMIEAGISIRAVPVDGGWLEFDAPGDHEAYESRRKAGTFDKFFNPAAFASP